MTQVDDKRQLLKKNYIYFFTIYYSLLNLLHVTNCILNNLTYILQIHFTYHAFYTH